MRSARENADGYRNELVPGLKATADAERLADELAFAAARLAELVADPPSLYAEIAAQPDGEEATWLAFFVAYLGPVEAGVARPGSAPRSPPHDPFIGIRAARTGWATGELPMLQGVPTGPRTAHDSSRGERTLAAYRACAGRAGSQAAAFTGDSSWTPERARDDGFLLTSDDKNSPRTCAVLLAGRIYDIRPERLYERQIRTLSGVSL